MADRVRVGLIGCGKIAQTHAKALATLPEADFVACTDLNVDRARATAEDYHIPRIFPDADALLASGEVEAAVVCTPHPSHTPLVIAAAEAGVHVICEKPITTRLTDADRMIAAAERAKIKFGVIFQRRFWPAAQRIRAAIDVGQLGNLTLGECIAHLSRDRAYFAQDAWRGKWATEGGGVLMNQAVHTIDKFQWFMGEAVEIFGRYATLVHGDYIDVEDTVVATVRFANGALGIIEASTSIAPNRGFRVAVHGDNGATASVWEFPEGKEGINDIWTVGGEATYVPVWEGVEERRAGFPYFHARQIQDFLHAVRDDRPPAVTGAEARKSLEIILAIYHSSRTGLPVHLPITGADIGE
ncbi:MAG: Gfo/Idh/MocA family protein [Thermomicrobiales bacterium]